jgi:hypothetical protein
MRTADVSLAEGNRGDTLPAVRPDDPQFDIWDEFRKIARQPAAERRAWFARFKLLLEQHPKGDEILETVRNKIRLARRMDRGALKYRHHQEQADAGITELIEGLLKGSRKLSRDRNEAIRTIAYIAVAGHLMPATRERLSKDDAQELLERWVLNYVTKPRAKR